jgi:uncharacterized protein (DUF433 family)
LNLPDFLIDHPDGEIRLKGHRISLYDVISFHQEGESAEMLYERFPSVPLSLIHNVLAFYRANKNDVDAYVAECEAELQRLRASAPQAPSLAELEKRMQSTKRETAK